MYTTGNSIYKENSNSFSGNEYYSVQILTKTLDKVVENHNLTDRTLTWDIQISGY